MKHRFIAIPAAATSRRLSNIILVESIAEWCAAHGQLQLTSLISEKYVDLKSFGIKGANSAVRDGCG
jgi:hypothetical protein